MRNVWSAAMLGVLALVTACRDPGQSRVRLVCAEYCRCVTLTEQAECNEECPQNLEPEEVSDACFECFAESRSCFESLEICPEICEDTEQPPPDPDDPEPIDAPPFVDAPF